MNASYEQICVEFERKNQQQNIVFLTFKLPETTKTLLWLTLVKYNYMY